MIVDDYGVLLSTLTDGEREVYCKIVAVRSFLWRSGLEPGAKRFSADQRVRMMEALNAISLAAGSNKRLQGDEGYYLLKCVCGGFCHLVDVKTFSACVLEDCGPSMQEHLNVPDDVVSDFVMNGAIASKVEEMKASGLSIFLRIITESTQAVLAGQEHLVNAIITRRMCSVQTLATHIARSLVQPTETETEEGLVLLGLALLMLFGP